MENLCAGLKHRSRVSRTRNSITLSWAPPLKILIKTHLGISLISHALGARLGWRGFEAGRQSPRPRWRMWPCTLRSVVGCGSWGSNAELYTNCFTTKWELNNYGVLFFKNCLFLLQISLIIHYWDFNRVHGYFHNCAYGNIFFNIY